MRTVNSHKTTMDRGAIRNALAMNYQREALLNDEYTRCVNNRNALIRDRASLIRADIECEMETNLEQRVCGSESFKMKVCVCVCVCVCTILDDFFCEQSSENSSKITTQQSARTVVSTGKINNHLLRGVVPLITKQADQRGYSTTGHCQVM
jgi:hypothetical protein